jgi:hypothetical protein
VCVFVAFLSRAENCNSQTSDPISQSRFDVTLGPLSSAHFEIDYAYPCERTPFAERPNFLPVFDDPRTTDMRGLRPRRRPSPFERSNHKLRK